MCGLTSRIQNDSRGWLEMPWHNLIVDSTDTLLLLSYLCYKPLQTSVQAYITSSMIACISFYMRSGILPPLVSIYIIYFCRIVKKNDRYFICQIQYDVLENDIKNAETIISVSLVYYCTIILVYRLLTHL